LDGYFLFLKVFGESSVPDALIGASPAFIGFWLEVTKGSASTKALRLSCVRSMYRALVHEGIMSSNPAREVGIRLRE